MGHERIGNLPSSKRWQDIVKNLGELSDIQTDVPDIANQTIENIRLRFTYIYQDPGVKAAFKFLVILAVSSREKNFLEELKSHGINVTKNSSPLSFAKAANRFIAENEEQPEYSQIAQSATADTISSWYKQSESIQGNLFAVSEYPSEFWMKAGNGAGFCELARLFFSSFIERYVNYLLERELSSSINNIKVRDLFNKQLKIYIEDVSKFSFETAKIAQSFAAGWFNKYALKKMPTDQEIEKFLPLAFGKIREELRRRAEQK